MHNVHAGEQRPIFFLEVYTFLKSSKQTVGGSGKKLQFEHIAVQWCCVTELEVPSSRTSSNFNGTGTELVPFQKWWNLL